MADRIPRIDIPSGGGISVPSVGSIRVQNTGRLNNIPRPVTARLEAPEIRTALPPVTTNLRPPVVNTPELEIIQYEPPVTNPAVKPGVGGVGNNNEAKEEEIEDTRDLPPPTPEIPVIPEQPVINVPIIGEVPVPPVSTVVLSGTTAVATVTATLIGKDVAAALLKWMKPVVKQAMLKLKKALKGDLTPYETQELLVFEGEKKLMKRLKAEQKAEKLRQASVHQAPPRQRIQMRMEKKDGNRPQT